MYDNLPVHSLVLDIETIPDGAPDYESLKTKEELRKEICKSKTDLYKEMSEKYKKEETILKHVEESLAKQEADLEDAYQKQTDDLDEEFRKGSLHSLKGRIFCIAAAFDNEEPIVFEYNVDEKKILEEFEKWIEETIDKKIYTTAFIGHNVQGFDIRWLWHRAVKYNLNKLKSWIPTNKFDKRIVDTNDLFNIFTYGKKTKLDEIATFLGIEGKNGMDGSQVYDYFLDNKYEEIHQYCKQDVVMTREIYKMLT